MPYLVLDLEMTGPEPDYNEIIQIGAEIYDDKWKLMGEFISNVYPENEDAFSSHSEEIHGISIDELEDAPMIYEVLADFEKWIRKCLFYREQDSLKGVVICGQSIINDINFLSFAYKKEKLAWPFSFRMLELHSVSQYAFMILENNGKKIPRSLSLENVASYFGFSRDGDTHNALEDARLTAKCFIALNDLAKNVILK
ncbi:MAG TPA: 3'-5' exonuclease [Bacteroidales bacterium]|jgi:DNA polymerase-3 subunit epsilon|nr:3'-5' exonuclease [Bacteroidales bacterium]MBP7874179.1 3'-5' exonuclease [Bacteroidales bacterium]MCZ2282726.1 3'-5' exonuclease [Bacteroidales bacterium]HPX34160.1 3'-5' exonuclease [Bacteroidales bacterium]HQB47460.1 3'-5' exonuclease [Bacteroidales bacterium]